MFICFVMGLKLLLVWPACAMSVNVPAQLVVQDDTLFNSVSASGTALSVSGYDPVSVEISVPSGMVKIGVSTGLSAPSAFNAADWAGAQTIGFEGALTDVNAALASLAVKGSGQAVTITVAPADIFFLPHTGHSYQYITAAQTWDDARADATARTVANLQGYLATIMSQTELDFIVNSFSWSGNLWVGGEDATTESSWIWADGPEGGKKFFQGRAGGTIQPGFFANWALYQPNNYRGQDHLGIDSNGFFLDFQGSAQLGYIVEYSGSVSQSQSFSVMAQAALSSQQAAAAIAVFQTAREDLAVALEDIFSRQLSEQSRHSARRIQTQQRWHQSVSDTAGRAETATAPSAPAFYIAAEESGGAVQAEGKIDHTQMTRAAVMHSLQADISYSTLANGKSVHSVFSRLTQAHNLHSRTAAFLQLGLGADITSGGYDFDFSSTSGKLQLGLGLSQRLAEQVYANILFESWVRWLKADYKNSHNQRADARLRSTGLSAASQLTADYQVTDTLWLSLSFSYSRTKEILRRKKITAYGGTAMSLDDLALVLPSSARLSAEPALRLVLGRDSTGLLREMKIAPSLACEKQKARRQFRECRKGYLLDFSLYSPDRLTAARFYLDYENLAAGPVHEYGFSMDVRF